MRYCTDIEGLMGSPGEDLVSGQSLRAFSSDGLVSFILTSFRTIHCNIFVPSLVCSLFKYCQFGR